MIGFISGKLTVIEFVKIITKKYNGKTHNLVYLKTRCECGRVKVAEKNNLKRKQTRSCGECGHGSKDNRRTHGMSSTEFYSAWGGIIGRTTNPKHKKFKRYGARGIKVCPRWQTFENFYEDLYPSYLKHKAENPGPFETQIDRIDNDGNYEPGNVRWVTLRENLKNRNYAN
jgi:hypothetical protein